jgi:hypothetical protein
MLYRMTKINSWTDIQLFFALGKDEKKRINLVVDFQKEFHGHIL